MIPAHARFAVILLGSFVLWLPALWSFLQGDLGVGAIGVRYVGALGVSGGAVALLGGLTREGAEAATRSGPDADAPEQRDRRAGDGARADARGPADRAVAEGDDVPDLER